jgi:NAD(P)-dependent dehydrogenase (short-subunit alcohol dehydrogenase family)
MSKPGDCRALIEKAGGCDILVNNAGIQHVARIEEFPAERWDAIIAINLSVRPSTPRRPRCRACASAAGAGSSISPRRTG